MTEEKKSKRMPTISHVLCWTCLHLDPPNYQLWPWLGYLSSVTVSPFVLLCTSDLTIRYNCETCRLKLILTLKNEIVKILEWCFMAHIQGNSSRYNLFWFGQRWADSVEEQRMESEQLKLTLQEDEQWRKVWLMRRGGQPTLLLFGGTQPGQG